MPLTAVIALNHGRWPWGCPLFAFPVKGVAVTEPPSASRQAVTYRLPFSSTVSIVSGREASKRT